MAQPLSNLVATQAAASPGAADDGESLPADLTALSLEQLMELRVGGRAQPQAEDAPPDPEAAARPGTLPGVAVPNTANAAGRPAPGDLPADLTALSLLQLMNLPLSAPRPEPEPEPEVAEGDDGTDETVAAVAQAEAGEDNGQDNGEHSGQPDGAEPPAAAGGAAFAAPDLDGDGETLPEDLLDGLGLNDDDPLEGAGAPVAGTGLQNLALLISDDDRGPGSAELFEPLGLDPEPGPDPVAASPGDQFLTGTPGNDVLIGGAGADTLSGLAGDDLLDGRAGADTLDGGTGKDTLLGGAGADTLLGGNGKDVLDGGAGKDVLLGGNGDDTLLGGAGADRLTWDKVDGIIDGGAGQDTLVAAGGNIDLTKYGGTLTSIENFELAGDGVGTSVTLDVQDVLDVSSTHVLTISGDLGDSIDAGTGWQDAGLDGAGNQTYTQMVGLDLATLVIDPEVAVNPDITM